MPEPPYLSAHDLRIFDRIRGELDAFDLGMKPIPQLITDVAVLLDDFQDISPSYAEELRQLWWPLQYALALSRDEERALTEAEEHQARDAVAVLAQRLAELDLPAR